jgi:hypothetical protein
MLAHLMIIIRKGFFRPRVQAARASWVGADRVCRLVPDQGSATCQLTSVKPL